MATPEEFRKTMQRLMDTNPDAYDQIVSIFDNLDPNVDAGPVMDDVVSEWGNYAPAVETVTQDVTQEPPGIARLAGRAERILPSILGLAGVPGAGVDITAGQLPGEVKSGVARTIEDLLSPIGQTAVATGQGIESMRQAAPYIPLVQLLGIGKEVVGGGVEAASRMSNIAGRSISELRQGNIPAMTDPMSMGRFGAALMSEAVNAPVGGVQPQRQDLGASLFPNDPEMALIANVVSPGLLGSLKAMRIARGTVLARKASLGEKLHDVGATPRDILKRELEKANIEVSPEQMETLYQALDEANNGELSGKFQQVDTSKDATVMVSRQNYVEAMKASGVSEEAAQQLASMAPRRMADIEEVITPDVVTQQSDPLFAYKYLERRPGLPPGEGGGIGGPPPRQLPGPAGRPEALAGLLQPGEGVRFARKPSDPDYSLDLDLPISPATTPPPAQSLQELRVSRNEYDLIPAGNDPWVQHTGGIGGKNIPDVDRAVMQVMDPILMSDNIDGTTALGLWARNVRIPAEHALMRSKDHLALMGKEFNKLLKKHGIGRGSEASDRIFRKMDGENIELTSGEKSVADFMRSQYEFLLDEMNKSRAEVGLPPIARRADYINHLWEESLIDILTGNSFTPAVERLRFGLAQARKTGAKAPWTAFSLQRKGKLGFQTDAIAAFEAYMPPAMRNIHMLHPASIGRAYAKYLPENLQEMALRWIDQGMLGRSTSLDRWARASWGKNAIFSTAAALGERVGRGLILGNMRTALAQLQSFPQVAAVAGFRNTARGFGRTLTSRAYWDPGWKAPLEGAFLTQTDVGWRFALENSRIVQSRRHTKWEDIVDPAKMTTAQDIISLPMEIADQFTVAASFNAGFIKARQLGLHGKDAIDYADDIAARTQAVFDRMYKPEIMRSRTFASTFGKFQTWGFRQFNELQLGSIYDIKGRRGMTSRDVMKRMALALGTQIGVNTIMVASGLPTQMEGLADFVPQPMGAFLRQRKWPGFGQELAVGEGSRPSPIADPLSSVLFKGADDLYEVFGDLTDETAGPLDRERHLRSLTRAPATFFTAGNAAHRLGWGIVDAQRGYTLSGKKVIPLESSYDAIRNMLVGSVPIRGEFEARQGKPQSIFSGQGIYQRAMQP